MFASLQIDDQGLPLGVKFDVAKRQQRRFDVPLSANAAPSKPEIMQR
jgi:hypothetical protein